MIFATAPIRQSIPLSITRTPHRRFKAPRHRQKPAPVQSQTLRKVAAKWDTLQHWRQAMNHFQMLWGERIQAALNR